ncbi:hypothetical protein WBS46_25405 [Bacillus albus]|uniref:hypothetical protein n=1 Tax=Bacillus cereus group TaxID=86661 RepID=UPI0022DECA7F|nr:hypothetical protein [Bacillus cereus group sp. Bc177]MDA2323984.1 hypothetical protein [Bacillus cereus group sp. Bc177]
MEAILDRKFNKFIENRLSHFQDILIHEGDYHNLNTKSAILELDEVVVWDKHIKTIKVDKSTFFKGVAIEILGLEKRISKQLENAKYIQKNCDYTWDFVTEYYLSFFLIITLCRMNGNFSTFIYKEEADKIADVATMYMGSKCNLNNAQYIVNVKNIDIENNLVTIDLQINRDTHATAWSLFNKFITDYRNLSGKKDTVEDNAIAVIEDYLRDEANLFSSLRNDLNYKYHKGFDQYNQIDIYDYIDWDSSEELVLEAILKLQKQEDSEENLKGLIVLNRLLLFLFEKLIQEFKDNLSIT